MTEESQTIIAVQKFHCTTHGDVACVMTVTTAEPPSSEVRRDFCLHCLQDMWAQARVFAVETH